MRIYWIAVISVSVFLAGVVRFSIGMRFARKEFEATGLYIAALPDTTIWTYPIIFGLLVFISFALLFPYEKW